MTEESNQGEHRDRQTGERKLRIRTGSLGARSESVLKKLRVRL